MKLKEIKRLIKRFGLKKAYITNSGNVILHPNNGDVLIVGYYTGKDNSILDSTIKVDPEDEYPKERVYDKTPMSKDFEKKCFNIDGSNSVFHEEHTKKDSIIVEMLHTLAAILLGEYPTVEDFDTEKHCPNCGARVNTKYQDFDPLEYLFEGAPVIGAFAPEPFWTNYCMDEPRDKLRLPTIEESPLNMKLAWHPKLGKPEGIDKYTFTHWYKGSEYPHKSDFTNWGEVTAFMLLKLNKKD